MILNLIFGYNRLKLEIYTQIYLVAFFQAIFFVFVTLKKKNKQINHYYLSFFILLLALECLLSYIFAQFSFSDQVIYYSFNILIWTLLGPSFYLYIKYSIYPITKFRKSDLLHLLPFVFVYLTLINFLIVHRYNLPIHLFFDTNHGFLLKTGIKVWQYSTFIYYTIVIGIIFFHRKHIKHFFSNISEINFSWILYITIGFAVYLGAEIIYLILYEFTGLEYNINVFGLFSILILSYIFGIGYLGVKQQDLFPEKRSGQNEYKILFNTFARQTQSKYASSNLTVYESNQLKDSLLEYMKTKKPYLDNELTILNLSECLNTTTHKLSQLLNESFNKNFYEFINSYRIDESMNLLNDPKFNNYTILAIAYECGFNSKTTFYTTFKKSVGTTPTQFRKNILEDLAVNH